MKELLMKEQLFELSTANFYGLDPATGLELYTGTLESDQLERTAEQEKVKGGIDNDTLTVIDKSSELTLTVTDVVNRRDMLATKLGTTIQNGEVTVKHLPRNYEVKLDSETKKVTLSATPIKPDDVKIYNNKTKKLLTKTTDYTISGAEITIVASDIEAGHTVFVTGFDYNTTADYIDIPSTSSTKAMQVIVEKPIWNANGEIVYYKQYNFPKAKIDGSFTTSGNTEKQANPDETKFTITKDGDEVSLGKIVYIPVSASVTASAEVRESLRNTLNKVK